MPLTVRTNGNNPINIVGANWWNDYYNLLTGAMTDQPVTLNYRPAASGNTAALTLATNGNAPLLIGLNSSGVKIFGVDQNGFVTFGAGVSGQYSQLDWDAVNHINVYWSPQSGVANAHVLVTWNGSAQVNALAVGGNFAGALAYFDNSGNLTLTGGVLTGKGGASITVGNAGTDVVLTPASGHWTYLNGSASASAYVDNAGHIHTGGNVYGNALFDNGNRVAIQGSHSAGQTIISYGTGQPGSLGANEVFIQLS